MPEGRHGSPVAALTHPMCLAVPCCYAASFFAGRRWRPCAGDVVSSEAAAPPRCLPEPTASAWFAAAPCGRAWVVSVRASDMWEFTPLFHRRSGVTGVAVTVVTMRTVRPCIPRPQSLTACHAPRERRLLQRHGSAKGRTSRLSARFPTCAFRLFRRRGRRRWKRVAGRLQPGHPARHLLRRARQSQHSLPGPQP